MKRAVKTTIIAIASFGLLAVILLTPLTYRKGISGKVGVYSIPLYVKICAFLHRDYEYRRLSREITEGCDKDEDKALAIYRWTVGHIRTNAPEEWPVVDDHILDIIIRGYGEPDQISDVFTTLCTYSGMKAYRDKIYALSPVESENPVVLVLSFVKVGGRWIVFDLYNRKYFLDEKGGLASVDEMIKNPELIKKSAGDSKIDGIEYEEFFKHLRPIRDTGYTRPEEQMATKRISVEINKVFKK